MLKWKTYKPILGTAAFEIPGRVNRHYIRIQNCGDDALIPTDQGTLNIRFPSAANGGQGDTGVKVKLTEPFELYGPASNVPMTLVAAAVMTARIVEMYEED